MRRFKRETKFLNAGQRKALGASQRGLVVLGIELMDAREEIFARLVCDGIALGVAFTKAGFTSKDVAAPSALFELPRVQERIAGILEARRTTGVVSLSQVTDMLQRVFAGAHAAEEFSAAHNAAFSLARLYGHVTDRNVLEVVRRPSRDPDAPSEQALGDWVASLPALPGPGPQAEPEPSRKASESPPQGSPALVLDHEPSTQPDLFNDINWLGGKPQGPGLGPSSPQGELFNDFNGLWRPEHSGTGGRPENGAPTRPVTGTPNGGGPSELLAAGGPGPTPIKKTRVPLKRRKVPVKKLGKRAIRKKVKIPSAKDLFG